jgi:hypothetical protein
MLRLLSKITITQQKTEAFANRNKIFILKFVNDIEISSGWQNMTDTCKIVLPRKVYLRDENGTKINWFGKVFYGDDIYGTGEPPLILRGDKIKIELGYNYPTSKQAEVIEMNTVFEGYISYIKNKMPITLECEDRMWQLKQIKVPDKNYSNKTYTVQSMMQELLSLQDSTKDIELKTGSSIGQKIETNLNAEFRTQNDTIGSVIKRLKDEARLFSYFRNQTELRCGSIVYFPSDRVTSVFNFQKNIISDNLEYKKLDDIKIGATCISLNETYTTTNKNGSSRKKTDKVETFVGDKDGELRTLHYINTSIADMQVLGKRELKRFLYEGYRGTFTTFGLPKVKHGDEVVLNDEILPERNGSYLVKSVKTSFGMGGFRQDIELHLKLSVYQDEYLKFGL